MKVYDYAIIGAGISGLTLAYNLKKFNKDVILIEKNSCPGGLARSEMVDGFLIEHGPNGFLANSPATLNLVNELNLEKELISTKIAAKKRFIVKNGRLTPLFQNPIEFIKSDLISTRAKARLFLEPFIKIDFANEISIYDFFSKKLGIEITETMIDPMVKGIHAGEIKKLSFKYAFKKFYKFYIQYGSLFRALLKLQLALKKEGTQKFSPFTLLSFPGGMGVLTSAIAAELKDSLYLNSGAEAIEFDRANNLWKILSERENFVSKNIILATPAYETAKLICNLDNIFSNTLNNIEYPPVDVVILGLKNSNLQRTLSGFGCLYPSFENSRVLGILWNSSIFEKRASSEMQNISVIMKGDLNDKIEEEYIINQAIFNCEKLFNMKLDPLFARLISHKRAIPQLSLGYKNVFLSMLDFCSHHQNIFFTGNYISGVGINDCVSFNCELAKRLPEENKDEAVNGCYMELIQKIL